MPEVLSGWKDIANYMGKGVRTVQRYERELGLPIRRPSGRTRGSVLVTKAELDVWINSAFHHLPASPTMPSADFETLKSRALELAALLEQLTQSINELASTRVGFETSRTTVLPSANRVHEDVLQTRVTWKTNGSRVP
jgi:hypothetical protein